MDRCSSHKPFKQPLIGHDYNAIQIYGGKVHLGDAHYNYYNDPSTRLNHSESARYSCRYRSHGRACHEDTPEGILQTQIESTQIESAQIPGHARSILEWLTDVDYRPYQRDLINRREKGTGEEVTTTAEFQTWLDGDGQMLLCTGKPGAGKTILSSIVVEQLQIRFGDNDSVGIAFVYIQLKRQAQQKPINLLKSILEQLLRRSSQIPQNVKRLYETHSKRYSQPTAHEISDVLCGVLNALRKTFVIVDALDELESCDGRHKEFLNHIFHLNSRTNANILVTCRVIPYYIGKFTERHSMIVEVRATKDDIEKYVKSRIFQLAECVLSNDELQQAVVSGISSTVDGMYLLAKLSLEALAGLVTPARIKSFLDTMPRDLTAYHAFYDLNMERISRSGLGTIAFEALSWICAVARPLSPTELQVALSMKKGLREIEMHNVPSIDDVISACAGMVIVDRNASVVRLIHRTAEEYFQKTWERWIPKAHETIMESCISYLSLQQFALGTCSSFQEYYGKIEKYPLFDYVSRNWGYHASKTKIRSDELPAAFRHSYAILQASYRAIFGPHSYRQDIPFPPRNAPTLCLLAHFGIPIAEVMLKGRIDNTESYYRTPLSHAIQEGHTNIALQLLKHGASPHTENWDGSTPFLFAVINANRRLIQAILDGEGNDISRICSHTPTSAYNQPSCFLPLCAAAGQVEIVEIILNYMDNERSKRSEFNLLSAKIWSKREVQRSEANYENKLRDRAMLAAAREGHDTIVTMLCGRGLNIEARDNNGCSPLSLAVQNGRDTTVQCLLSLGANIEIQDNAGRTPLHYAVRSNNLPVIQMLLGRNGRIDGRDGAGYTALFYAVRGKNVAVLKCLVEKIGKDSVTLNSRDHQNRTALSHAAEKGHFQAVKLLLETGADVTIYDNEFRTPFHWAFKCGHREIASILARCPSPISSVESLSSEESLQCEESLSSDGSGTNHFGSSCEGRIPSLEEIFE